MSGRSASPRSVSSACPNRYSSQGGLSPTHRSRMFWVTKQCTWPYRSCYSGLDSSARGTVWAIGRHLGRPCAGSWRSTPNPFSIENSWMSFTITPSCRDTVMTQNPRDSLQAWTFAWKGIWTCIVSHYEMGSSWQFSPNRSAPGLLALYYVRRNICPKARKIRRGPPVPS